MTAEARPTGIFASAEDIATARQKFLEAQAPVIKVHGRWLHEDAAEAAHVWLDQLAVRYGLPPPGLVDGKTNHYGMAADGEFTVSK